MIKIIIEAPISSDLEACVAACFTMMNGSPNLDMVTLRLLGENAESMEIILDRASTRRSWAFTGFLERVQERIRTMNGDS